MRLSSCQQPPQKSTVAFRALHTSTTIHCHQLKMWQTDRQTMEYQNYKYMLSLSHVLCSSSSSGPHAKTAKLFHIVYCKKHFTTAQNAYIRPIEWLHNQEETRVISAVSANILHRHPLWPEYAQLYPNLISKAIIGKMATSALTIAQSPRISILSVLGWLLGTNLIHDFTAVTFSMKLAFFCEKRRFPWNPWIFHEF